jgi:hypothetical protein
MELEARGIEMEMINMTMKGIILSINYSLK